MCSLLLAGEMITPKAWAGFDEVLPGPMRKDQITPSLSEVLLDCMLMWMHVCAHGDARGQPQASSSGTLSASFEIGSLITPELTN